MTGPGNRETPITSWDRGLVQADPDAAIREIRELRAARVRAEEALRDARRYCESYCEATDPDPRDDDREEMSVASAYVLSAMLAIDEGLAAVGDNTP